MPGDAVHDGLSRAWRGPCMMRVAVHGEGVLRGGNWRGRRVSVQDAAVSSERWLRGQRSLAPLTAAPSRSLPAPLRTFPPPPPLRVSVIVESHVLSLLLFPPRVLPSGFISRGFISGLHGGRAARAG